MWSSLAVHVSVYPSLTGFQLKNKKGNKNKNWCVNVPQGKSNQCANFYPKRSKISVQVTAVQCSVYLGRWLHNMPVLGQCILSRSAMSCNGVVAGSTATQISTCRKIFSSSKNFLSNIQKSGTELKMPIWGERFRSRKIKILGMHDLLCRTFTAV